MEGSPSQIRNFTSCPRYWAEGAQGPGGAPALIGKEFHFATEQSELAAMAGEKDKTPMSFVPTTLEPAIRDRVLDLLARWQAEESYQIDPEKLLSVEANDSEHIHPTLGKHIYRSTVGDHTLAGIPDRVSLLTDDVLLVDDRKTGMAIPDDPIQLGCYAVLASDHFGIKKVKARFLFPAIGLTISYWYDENDIEYARVRICGILDSMAKSQAPHQEKINPKCVHCIVKGNCAEYAKVLAGQVAPPPPELTDIVQIAALRDTFDGGGKIHEDMKDKLADTLEGLLGKDGVIVNGEKWECRKIPQRYHYPAIGVIDVLKEYGLLNHLTEIVEISSGDVTRLLKDKEVLAKLGKEQAEKFVASITDLRQTKSVRRQFVRKPIGGQA